MLVTVTTDLLWGIIAGIVMKFLLEFLIVANVERSTPHGRESTGMVLKRRIAEAGELFRDPVVKSVSDGSSYHMYFGRPMVCFNSMQLHQELSAIPGSASSVTLHVTDMVTLIDHTTLSALLEFVDSFKKSGRGIATIVGLDRMRPRSHSAASMLISVPILAEERANSLKQLARIGLFNDIADSIDSSAEVERISLIHEIPSTASTTTDAEESDLDQEMARDLD